MILPKLHTTSHDSDDQKHPPPPLNMKYEIYWKVPWAPLAPPLGCKCNGYLSISVNGKRLIVPFAYWIVWSRNQMPGYA